MPSKKSKTPDVVPYKGKALQGKGSKKDVASFDPAGLAAAGPAEAEPPARPRPAKTRYPISMEAFAGLKVDAVKPKGKPPKLASTIAKDKTSKAVELAAAPVAAERAMLEPAAPPALAPVALSNFHGLSATGSIPPDCTMAAGPSHVLLSANRQVAVYNKTGGVPLLQKTLNQWFGNVISNASIFDPKAIYDQHFGRWVLLTVAVPAQQGLAGSWFLLSVSQTSNPLGGWWNYKLDAAIDGSTPTANWADYPGLGVDAFNLYLTANMFEFDGDFAYAKLRVISKALLYAGLPATWFDFTKLKNADGSFAFTVQPCHTFGAPGLEYLVNSYYPSSGSSTKNRLSLWSVTPTPIPSLSLKTVTTDPYGLPPDAAQKGGGTPLDTGDIRVLNAAFRAGSVWCCLTSRYNWGSASNVASVHWFQVNATSGAMIQQGLFGFNNRSYFYPALMPDTNGNMVLCYSRCSPSEFVSIWFTGRKSTDPIGMLQNSALLKAGVANYVALDQFGRNRWGDYTGVANDPSDGRIISFYNEYALAGNNWDTWVGQAKF
jgi:hypothetical protein